MFFKINNSTELYKKAEKLIERIQVARDEVTKLVKGMPYYSGEISEKRYHYGGIDLVGFLGRAPHEWKAVEVRYKIHFCKPAINTLTAQLFNTKANKLPVVAWKEINDLFNYSPKDHSYDKVKLYVPSFVFKKEAVIVRFDGDRMNMKYQPARGMIQINYSEFRSIHDGE